jgi:hypothetical protein
VTGTRYRGAGSVLSIMILLASALGTELPPPILPGKGPSEDDEDLLPDEAASTCPVHGCSLIDEGDGPYCPACESSSRDAG